MKCLICQHRETKPGLVTTTKIGTGATPRGREKVYLAARKNFALIRSQHVFDR